MRGWKKVVLCCLGMLMLFGMPLAMMKAGATEMPEKSAMPEEVAPLTDEDFNLLKYGTRIVIPEGVRYYASADGFGSGDFGAIGSQWTSMGMDAYVGGFALLDNDGRLVEYCSYNPANIPVSECWQNETSEIVWDQVWIGFFVYTGTKDVDMIALTGWLPVRSIAVINGIMGDGGSNEKYQNGVIINHNLSPEEPELEDFDPENLTPAIIDAVLPDPGNMIEDRVIRGQDIPDDDEDTAFITTREIAYAIEDYADNGEKIALLLDGSSSVSDYMSAIADYGEYVDKVNKADIIITFGKDYLVIRAEEYLAADIDRRKTDIYTPLSSLPDVASYDRIIIVTDSYHNADSEISVENCEEFNGKIVVVSPVKLRNVKKGVIQDIEEAFGTKVYLCLLDNELDRILALELLGNTQ